MAEILILDELNAAIVAPIAFGPLAPGATSAVTTLHVWWARGEPAEADQEQGALIALARLAGGGDPFRSDSTRLQLAGGIEMRLDGGAWIAQRNGSALRLPTMPADDFVVVEWRVTAPVGAGSALDIEMLIEPHVLRASAATGDLERGVILSGLGDRRRSGIYSQGGDVVAQGPETDTVDTPAVGWGNGRSWWLAASTFTPSATDANSDALGAGEGYVSALTLGDGAYVEVKGVKAALPLDESDRPTVPDDTPVLAWIVRDDSAAIGAGEITQGRGAGLFSASSSGLVVTIDPDGPGAVVGGRFIRYRTPQPVTMLASVTQEIYLLPDSSLERVTIGDDPVDPLAIPIWRATTDATDVTELVDLRPWYPARDSLRFVFGAMVTGAVAHLVAPRDLDVLPIEGQAQLALVDDPGSSASTDVAIEKSVPGSGSWSTIATLSVANGAAPASASALPVATRIDAGDILRAIVTGQTGTAQPTGGAAVLLAR